MNQGKTQNGVRMISRVGSGPTSIPHIHLFGSNNPCFQRSMLINFIEAHKIPYSFEANYEKLLDTVQMADSSNRMVVIETVEIPKGALEEELRKGLQQKAEKGRTKLFTYPNKVQGTKMKNLTTAQQVVNQYHKMSGEKKRPKVELRGLHSISKQKTFSKDKAKLSNSNSYESILYYYMSAQNDYQNQNSDIYSRVVDIFKKESTYQQFSSASSLAKTKERPKGKKSLLVIPAIVSDQLLKEIEKGWKQQEVGVIVVGKVEANDFYLNKRIVLVTNSPSKLYEYLQENQFISPHLIKSLFQRLIESTSHTYQTSLLNNIERNSLKNIESKIISKQPQIFMTREVSNEYQMPAKQPQANPEGKHKVKKLKSPIKSRPNTESSEHLNALNISVLPPSPGLIVQTSQFRTNKQGEVISKSKSTQESLPHSSPNIPAVQNHFKSSLISSSHQIGSAQTENYNQKQTIPSQTLNNKYKSSYVIPETSDQHRGSNKDSLLNLQTDNKRYDPNQKITFNDFETKSRHYTQLQTTPPYQEIGERKMVHSLMNNTPDRQLISSNQNIREIPYSGIRKGASESLGEADMSRNMQKVRVIKKEQHLAPLQVKIQSTNRIQDFTSQNQKPIYSQSKYNSSPTNYQSIQSTNNYTTQLANNYTVQPTTTNYINAQTTTNYTPSQSTTTNYINTQPTIRTYTNNQPSTTNYTTTQPASPNYATTTNYTSQASSYPSRTNQYGAYQTNNIKTSQTNLNSNVKTQPNKTTEIRIASSSSPEPTTVKPQTTNYTSNTLNLEGYQRVEVNGITMYRKKAQAKPSSTQTHQLDGSPKVVRYEVSPRRNLLTSAQQQQKQPTVQAENRFTTYNTYHKNGQIGQNNQETYRSSTYYPNQPNYDSHKQVQNRGSTYYPHQITQKQSPREVQSKQHFKSIGSTQNVSIKLIGNQDEFITKIGNMKGELKQKVEVQRREYKEFKVEAPNIKVHKPEEKKASTQELKVEPNLRLLNQSNWGSKPSEMMLSDGSILRRNNIRFGIKLKQKQEKLNESCMNQTKIFNGTYNINDLNKKMALHRKIQGEEQLAAEEQKYIHINTHLSAIHYLFQEELRYYQKKINALFGPIDKVDFFSCLEQLSQKAFSLMDCGFIVMVQQQGEKVSPTMLPQNYYIIFIEKGEDFLLQIDEDQKKIRMDSLERLTLAEKIILDSRLNKCVLYKVGDVLVEGVGDKFASTEFQTEKLEIELTNEVLDCFYQDEPRLTRLYIFCLEQELKNTMKVIDTYEKSNPFFNRASCKVICPLKNTNNLTRLKKDYPSVVFLSTLSMTYKQIIEQAHKSDKPIVLQIKPDRLYLHEKQSSIAADIEKYFPGRFQIILFQNMQTISKKTSKFQLQKFNSYLVLSDSISGQKVPVENFTKVFMMGRAKALPNNVVRVMKKEQLIELLKK